MEELITQHMNWLKSQSIVTKCKWEFKQGIVLFRLYRGEWMWTSNFM